MPSGTLRKFDGFAASLYDPGSTFTIADYCRERSLPYSDVGLPGFPRAKPRAAPYRPASAYAPLQPGSRL